MSPYSAIHWFNQPSIDCSVHSLMQSLATHSFNHLPIGWFIRSLFLSFVDQYLSGWFIRSCFFLLSTYTYLFNSFVLCLFFRFLFFFGRSLPICLIHSFFLFFLFVCLSIYTYLVDSHVLCFFLLSIYASLFTSLFVRVCTLILWLSLIWQVWRRAQPWVSHPSGVSCRILSVARVALCQRLGSQQKSRRQTEKCTVDNGLLPVH